MALPWQEIENSTSPYFGDAWCLSCFISIKHETGFVPGKSFPYIAAIEVPLSTRYPLNCHPVTDTRVRNYD
jgi:hypothetical protein